MGIKQYNKGVKLWPKRDDLLNATEVVSLYERGFAGAWQDEEAEEELLASLPYPDGEKVCEEFGLAGTGQGKLSLAYLPSWNHWPKAWPSPAQETGDCVSRGGKNSAFVLIGAEVEAGQPDEITGVVEGFPSVSAEGERNGVVCCENIYGARGHGGQGANCSTLQRYMTSQGGILLRQNYPELGIDFTSLNTRLGMNWGGRGGPPSAVNAEGAKHQIRTCTNASTHEVCRDFIANYYPIWACSGLGWSSKRDENGYSRQSGSWSHSWIIMGYDDRDETKQRYGFPLALYNHDWGRWNSGGRDVLNSSQFVPAHLKDEWVRNGLVSASTGNILIPEGAMWIDARLLNRCDTKAMASTNGWPGRTISWMEGWA